MIKRLLFVFSLLTILLGCADNENDDDSIIIGENDSSAPIVSISSLKDELENGLEVQTTFNITVTDESDIVNTTILVNDDEIINTELKSFSFELNPFNYPIGDNKLSFISTDKEGNKNENSQTFEVRKLLVSVAAPAFSNELEVFFSANTTNGDLVAFEKVTKSLEIIKLYADDNFNFQPIILSSYILNSEATQKAQISSIASIIPGTDLVILQEAGGISTENTVDLSPITQNDLIIDISDIESERIANSIGALGFNHLAEPKNIFEEPSGFNTQVFYNHRTSETIKNTLIYTSNIFTKQTEAQVEIDNYKYLFLENPSNSTVSFQEFKIPSRQVINIPNTATTCFLRTFGYLDTEAFRSHDFRFIYDINIENTSNSLEIPVIEEFETLRNSLILTLNDRRRLEVSTLGLKDVSVPDWTASRSGNIINMTGEFDKFTLSFILGDNPDISMVWSFTDKYQENYAMPFESFEFPQEFINYASAHSLNLLDFNTRGIFNVEQFDTSETLDYEDLLFSIYTYTFLGDVYILRSDL